MTILFQQEEEQQQQLDLVYGLLASPQTKIDTFLGQN